METKFTPGPWVIKPEELERSYIRIRGGVPGTKYKIANVLGTCAEGKTYDEIKQVRANAHLIAAAPDMYEALYNLSSAFAADMKVANPDGTTGCLDLHYVAAELALAKARGEQ